MNWFLEDSKEQIYWEEVIRPYTPKSKAAQDLWENMQPFLPGEEETWQEEMEYLTIILDAVKIKRSLLVEWEILFSGFYDIRSLLDKLMYRKFTDTDYLTDLFSLKQFLWISHQLSQQIINTFAKKQEIIKKTDWFQTAEQPWETWLKILQPKNKSQNYYPNFALQDIDDDKLANLRRTKRIKLREIREYEKKLHTQLQEIFDVKINLERYLIISAGDRKMPLISDSPFFKFIRKQGEEYIYYLELSKDEIELKNELTKIDKLIIHEEKRRLEEIWQQLISAVPIWINAHISWGKFEVYLKKVHMAIEMDGVRPIINKKNKYTFEVKNGEHPHLKLIWNKVEHSMKLVSIMIDEGITVIYGANMSGKTIVLRTVGLLIALAHYGFFVPAGKFSFSLINHLSLLSGDYQNISNGLSSFGAEVIRLNRDLSCEGKVMYLLDEIGKGTNPFEGEALAIGTLRYLKQKKGVCCLMVTHYPNLITEDDICLYEVNAYQPIKVSEGMIPLKGIATAAKLGLQPQIINFAKEYLKHIKVKGK